MSQIVLMLINKILFNSLQIFLIFSLSSNCSALSKQQLIIQSPAFNNGEFIPSKYTCNGENISPPLAWKNEPSNTKSFVLILDDPDAPSGNWVHWIIFNMSNLTHKLPENLSSLPTPAHYSKNSWGNAAYAGPCPPSGTHRYFFKLYALDTMLALLTYDNESQIEEAMKGHILSVGTMMAKYKK